MSSFGPDRGCPERATVSAGIVPSACPVCQSPSVAAAARTPDTTTYWRCRTCGEVWNVGRRQAVRPGGPRWR